MKLEQQVTSLEISKRLKELGVKQESYFWYRAFTDKDEQLYFVLGHHDSQAMFQRDYSAFTVAELGEILPEFVESYKSHDEGFNWFCRKFEEGDILKYTALENADTEADARGKMLIYLLENKLITL